jgi:hypothetical protein
MSYPTQDLPPVPERPTAPPRKKRRGGLALLVVVAILGTVGLTAGGLYLGGIFATEVSAAPFDSPGVDPFGPSVGDGQSVPITPVAQIQTEAAVAPQEPDPQAVSQPQPAAPVTTAATPPQDRRIGLASSGTGGTTVSGDTVGLYGGSQNNAVCDPAKLVQFLQANPDKARAWAEVERVPVDQIPAFVATLTPVILRTDTAVINHGFRDGVANPFNAVLQAGTAVLVDRNGVPRVRCKCGNPLLPPRQYSQIAITGNRWLGFDERNITYIQRSRVEITVFRIVILCQCGYGPPPLVPGVPGVPGDPQSVVPGDPAEADGPVTSSRRTTSRAPRSVPEQQGQAPAGGGGSPAGGGGGEPAGGAGDAPSGGGETFDGGAESGGDRPVPPERPN